MMSSLALGSEVNEKDTPLPVISRTTAVPADSLEGRLANPQDKYRDVSVEEWDERVVAALNDQSRPLPRVW
jgi:hypothetical protein